MTQTMDRPRIIPLDQQPEMPDVNDGREPVNTETKMVDACWLCKGVYPASQMVPIGNRWRQTGAEPYRLCPTCHERKHGKADASDLMPLLSQAACELWALAQHSPNKASILSLVSRIDAVTER